MTGHAMFTIRRLNNTYTGDCECGYGYAEHRLIPDLLAEIDTHEGTQQ